MSQRGFRVAVVGGLLLVPVVLVLALSSRPPPGTLLQRLQLERVRLLEEIVYGNGRQFESLYGGAFTSYDREGLEGVQVRTSIDRHAYLAEAHDVEAGVECALIRTMGDMTTWSTALDLGSWRRLEPNGPTVCRRASGLWPLLHWTGLTMIDGAAAEAVLYSSPAR